jgi:CD2 antigen cytoplasmic tail-binding protein 2
MKVEILHQAANRYDEGETRYGRLESPVMLSWPHRNGMSPYWLTLSSSSPFHPSDIYRSITTTETHSPHNMAGSSSNFSAARPKRAGDNFTRTHHLDSNEPSAKKPRFDPRNPSTLAPDNDDEEDPTLEADVIGKGAGVKRNAVNIDGYDSDSSTENFDARAEARDKKSAPEKDEDEDDDMFAEDKDDDQNEDTRRGDKKNKKLRFLDNEEILGQEDSSKAGGHVEVDFGAGPKSQAKEDGTSSESGDDEERDMMDPELDEEIGAGGKKKHAPKLDAFNMKEEQEEGRFDESGNFVRKAFDADAVQDAWLDGLSKKDIKKAKLAHEKREEERKKRERDEDSIVTSEVLSTMILHLGVGETPMEALVRHGKAVPKKKTVVSKKKKAQDMDIEPDPAEAAAAAKATEAINDITESASRLTDRGVEDVYDLPREMIMRQYKRETGEDWKNPNPSEVQWEFHWMTAAEGENNGPYDTETMRAWEQSGQFAAGAEFRKVGESEWSRLLDLDD